jgi:hypothetical protein
LIIVNQIASVIPKENKMTEEKTLSRSEREAQLKDRAGWVITIIALLLAVTTYVSNGYSSKILTNTIKANDTWNFYQAKSIKQSIAEGQLEETKDPKRKEMLEAKIQRYESDPVKNEGKKELMAKALQIESERDEAKKHTPWLTFAAMAFQLAIVLLSASILAVSKRMYWGSIGVSIFGTILLTQGIWLILPLMI